MKEQRQRKIRQIVKILNAKYAEDFHGWVRDNIDFSGLDFDDLTWQQIEIGNAIIHDKNVCVAGGGGIGKTAVAALLILWFLSSFLDAKIPTTAPSGKLLDDILWSEISTWLNRCKLKHLFELKSGKLQIKEFKEWYAVARTVPRDGKQLN
ncbi:MAG TPA: hypothetical protein PLS36_05765, partial [Clostridia bacterium]|nr:hypothetical protein [Clostridia bacterium]